MSNKYATSVTWGGIVYVMRPDDEGRLYGYRVNEDGSEALVTQGYDEEESCYVALMGAHRKLREAEKNSQQGDVTEEPSSIDSIVK